MLFYIILELPAERRIGFVTQRQISEFLNLWEMPGCYFKKFYLSVSPPVVPSLTASKYNAGP